MHYISTNKEINKIQENEDIKGIKDEINYMRLTLNTPLWEGFELTTENDLLNHLIENDTCNDCKIRKEYYNNLKSYEVKISKI